MRTCYACGNEMIIDENEISYHLDEDGNVDYDQDADHVAIDESLVETV